MILARRLLVQASAALCVECQHQKEADFGLDMAIVQEINPSSLTFILDSVGVA
jgi:hypothetical protein